MKTRQHKCAQQSSPKPWGGRLSSYWGRPGARRDFEQEKGRNVEEQSQEHHYELSPRERMWRSRMDDFKRLIVDDPYEALFGRSNRMLRGIVVRSDWVGSPLPLPAWMRRELQKMNSDICNTETNVREVPSKLSRLGDSKSSSTAPKAKRIPIEPDKSDDAPSQQQISHSSASPPSTPPIPDGPLEYDPISNRMVRKSDKAFSHYGQELDLGIDVSVKPVSQITEEGPLVTPTEPVNTEPTAMSKLVMAPERAPAKDPRQEYNEYRSRRLQSLEPEDGWLAKEGFLEKSNEISPTQENIDRSEREDEAGRPVNLENAFDTTPFTNDANVADLKPWRIQRSHGTSVKAPEPAPSSVGNGASDSAALDTALDRHSNKPGVSKGLQTALQRRNKHKLYESTSTGATKSELSSSAAQPRREHEPYGYDHGRESTTAPAIVNNAKELPSAGETTRETGKSGSVFAVTSDPAADWPAEAKKEYLEGLEKELQELDDLKDPQAWMRQKRQLIEGKRNLIKNRFDLKGVQSEKDPDASITLDKLRDARSRLRGLLRGPLAWLEPKRDPTRYASEQEAMQQSAEGKMLAAEVEKQKEAMRALEESPRSFQSFVTSPEQSIFPDPEQLHKRAAEETAKREQKAKHADLVRDIRDIYENEYGQITSTHRQPGVQQPGAQSQGSGPEASTPIPQKAVHNPELLLLKPEPSIDALTTVETIPTLASPATRKIDDETEGRSAREGQTVLDTLPETTAMYTILAYDPSSSQVSSATVSSPPTEGEKAMPLTLALRELSEPAKFLPHLHGLRESGLVPISSSNNLLVLRKIQEPAASELQSAKSPTTRTINSEAVEGTKTKPLINPIDKTGAHVPTGDFASPTGFVNYNTYEPRANPESFPSTFMPRQPNQNPQPTSEATPALPLGGKRYHRHHKHHKCKLRRVESVFSGGARRHFEHKRRHRRFWRVLTKVAATFGIAVAIVYLAGVFAELKRESRGREIFMRKDWEEAGLREG